MIVEPGIDRYLTRTWYTKRLKRLKKKQWVGQPYAILSSKVTLDPYVRAANWACDSLTYNNVRIAEQADGFGWVETTGDSHIDWRELWGAELERHTTFAWLLVHVGPEGLYQAAKLSNGEAEVMRLKQEGHTLDQVALITGKSINLVKNAKSRGYAKIVKAFNLPARPKSDKRLNRVATTLAGISRRKEQTPQAVLDLAGISSENLLTREAA